ncbi:MAG: pyridoxamine 5'-phosphate oxidase family protein [Ilumatobacter sp.]|uniref:pyridoxamine 5'-phosphate oxidase family protein n=1 Tax=Ilumatobacter sp. TaxID=1967498 RepID=UPI0032979649
MGRTFDDITEPMKQFIEQQHVFFVATAPLDGAGRVNLSPKGYDSFRLLDEQRVAYLDLTGSGAETIAHLRENGRITFMFCAFEGKPNIVRLHGTGRVVRAADGEWDGLLELFDGADAADGAVRSIIVADIDRTSMSCGYSVPFMEFTDDRRRLLDWAEDKSEQDLEDYWAAKNSTSIDGLPALG